MKLIDYIGAISRAAAEGSQNKAIRRVVTGAAALARKSPDSLTRMMSGIGQAAELENTEISTWADHGEDMTGRKFDVCDLRVWLDLAEAAGIPSIPAKQIATLSEDELALLLGNVVIPPTIRDTINKGMISGVGSVDDDQAGFLNTLIDEILPRNAGVDRDAVGRGAFEKIESCLDEIPSDWMVRTHIAGSSNLKALVGCGLMTKGDETAKVAEGFEIGGGWVRQGNRRMIDFADPRFVELGIGGHKPDTHYLARPWAVSGRLHQGEDLHRANTPLAGPGQWPAEWRVFARGGNVTGVANYYGWTGEGASPENAWNAIEAAAAGQAIVDEAKSRDMLGMFMTQVFMRAGAMKQDLKDASEEFAPHDEISCTLDFFEGQDGLLFLEGGPGHVPGGGGHPCAFAGQQAPGLLAGAVALCEGVAYKNMPHVHLGDPKTWIDGDRDGCIEGWAAAAERAIGHAPLSPRATSFLERFGVSSEPALAP